MCGFCNKIYTAEEAHRHVVTTLDPPYLVIAEDCGTYTLWYSCDDPFYSGKILTIGFCPVCGMELSKKTKY